MVRVIRFAPIPFGFAAIVMSPLIICMALGVHANGAALAQEKSAPPPLAQNGVLNKAQPQFEQIFQFAFDGAKIKLERSGWGDVPKTPAKPAVGVMANAPPIELIFNQIRTNAGQVTSSGGSYSTRYRDLHFGGANLSGRIRTSGDVVRMEFEEMHAPQRTLEWTDDGQGALKMMLSQPDGDLLLLQQSKQGTFTMTGVIGGKPFAAQGATFLAMYKQHRQVMDTQVLPVLQSLAIRLIPSPTTPEMKKAVLALITRTPELIAEGKKLIGALDSEKFQTRDKASKLLNERFEIYKDLIEERLKDSGISQEAASRLNKIMAAHLDAQKISQTIAALDLLRDPAYLVGVLAEAEPADRAKVAAQLETVTGQRLGADPEAWQRWLAAPKR